MADAIQSAIYRLSIDSADYARNSKLVEAANKLIDDSFTRTEAKVDKAIANERKLAMEILKTSRAVEEGRITQERAAAHIQRAAGAYGPYTAATGRAAEATMGFGTALSSARGFLATFGISLGLIQLVRMGSEALQAAGDLGELAQQLGVGTQALQTYQFAATQVGIEQSELETGLARLTRTIGDAAEGNNAAVDAFNKLGVGVLDANKKIRTTDEILLDVADALSKIEDPARRAAIEVDLFGKSGQKLDTIFTDGRAGVEAYREEMERLRLQLTDEQIKAADDAADAMARLGFEFDQFKMSIAAGLAGPLADFLEWRRKLIDIPDGGLFGGPGDAEVARQLNLGAIRDEIAGLTEEIERLQATNKMGGGLFGVDEFQIERNNEIIADNIRERAALFAKLAAMQQGGGIAGSGLAGAPAVPPGTSNPPSQAALAAAEREREKAERERLRLLADLVRAEEQFGRSLDTVLARIDPVAAAARQLANDEGILFGAMARGIEITGGYAAAFEKLEQVYQDSISPITKALHDLNEAQDEQVRALDLELRMIGLSAEERAPYLAALEAENKLREKGIPLTDAAAQAYIEEAKAIASRTAEQKKQIEDAEAGQKILEGFFDQSFDRIGGGITEALATGQIEMAKFGDIGRAVISELIQLMIQLSVINPLKNALGVGGGNAPDISDLFSLIQAGIGSLGGGGFGGSGYIGPIARGAAFNRTGVMPFAAGGVVGSPTLFPMANGGTGLMGEAGPEAVMPLSRTADGRLGVVANDNGGGIVISQNITIHSNAGTPQQNQDQANRIASEMKLAVKAAVEQEVTRMQRTNGRLNFT